MTYGPKRTEVQKYTILEITCVTAQYQVITILEGFHHGLHLSLELSLYKLQVSTESQAKGNLSLITAACLPAY